MTTINSVNSPTFGCGACAQLKKIARQTYENPKEVAAYYSGFQAAKRNLQEKQGLTEGQAASQILKNVRISIKRLDKRT